MKKIILLFALLLSAAVNAQSNPGNMPELLIGKEIRILPLPTYEKKNYYSDFYTNPDLKDSYKLVGYKFGETPVDALLGRTFTVISVKSFKDKYDVQKTSVELKDDKETIYYSYKDGPYWQPFEVIGGLTYPNAFYDGYTRPYSFSDKTGIETIDKDREHINFQKLSGKTPKFMLTVQASSDLPANGRKGLVLHLENGQDLNFPKADVHDWISPKGYRTVIILTPAQIEVLKANRITGYMLLDKKEEVDSDNSYYIRASFNRLLAR